MTQYAIVTDVNRCVGCHACTVSCKMVNGVPIGHFWNKVLRIGPIPKPEGAGFPDVDLYFMPVSCQHCEEPECVKVCPTGASYKAEDGTVQINKEKCIGCQFCAMACPYGVRYLNEDEGVVEKCTLCHQRKLDEGELPQCVSGCVGMARWFGDIENEDITQFRGPLGKVYGDLAEEFTDENLHNLPDAGNHPSYRYILRNMTWQGWED